MKVLASFLPFVATLLVYPLEVTEAKLWTSRARPNQTKNLKNVTVVSKEHRKLIDLVGYGGTPSSIFLPLAQCEGDCDEDFDCADGLTCFQRNGGESVPGCNGGESISRGTDFCINPADESESTGPSNPTTPQSRQWGKGSCEGDCDEDSDCAGGLICFQRKRGDAAPEQCPNINTNTQIDYCVEPEPRSPTAAAPVYTAPIYVPTAPVAAPVPAPVSAPVPAPTAPVPAPTVPVGSYTGSGLDHCGGDCDRDSDCKNGLICYQRESGDPVPDQCSGPTNNSKDYCIDPNLSERAFYIPDDPVPLTMTHRLKMYWEEGYEWQDENFEREWCVMRDFDGYPGRGKCWYGLDVLPCRSDHVYIAKCMKDKRQDWLFEYVNDSEAIVKVDGQDQCLHRSGVNIVLRPCDSGSKYQRFFAIRGGFDEYRFELSQKSATRYCLNQAHHPKPGEVLAMYPCARARSPDHMTSWFEFF